MGGHLKSPPLSNKDVGMPVDKAKVVLEKVIPMAPTMVSIMSSQNLHQGLIPVSLASLKRD